MRRLVLLLLLPGCTGSIGPAPNPGGAAHLPPDKPIPFYPAPVQLQRLQAWQYKNAVGDLVGADGAAAADPPADSAVNGYDAIGSSQLALSDSGVVNYESSALAISEAAITGSGANALLGCDPDASGPPCLQSFIARFGRMAFRRALTSDELSAYFQMALGVQAQAGTYREGARYAIAAFLQSPNFLYQVYVGEPDPADATRRRLTSMEMATRLSFFLTGTTPDETLLEAAETGLLSTPKGVKTQAERLVRLPEAQTALHSFFDEMFKLRDLPGLSRNTTMFPGFDAGIRGLLRQETLQLIDHVVWEEDGDFREVLDAPYTYLNDDLAHFYGLTAPGSADMVKVDLPADTLRAGILGQGSFLAVNAHSSLSSPTLRGKFVREVLTCRGIPSPPPGVNSTLAEPMASDPPKTMRERLASHETDPVCASCHSLMDSIGLGLENFDATGAFRSTDGGLPVDALSTMDGKSFAGAAQLGALLRSDPAVARCLARNVFRHATGHVEIKSEEESLEAVDAAFASSGYRMQALLVQIAESDAFRYAAQEAP